MLKIQNNQICEDFSFYLTKWNEFLGCFLAHVIQSTGPFLGAGRWNAQCEISLQIFRSQKTCQMNWNSILEKTGLEI